MLLTRIRKIFIITIVVLIFVHSVILTFFTTRSRPRAVSPATNTSSYEIKETKDTLENPAAEPSIYRIQRSKCPQIYGSVALIQFVDSRDFINTVFNAVQSLRCYAKMRGYTLYQFEIKGANVTLLAGAEHVDVELLFQDCSKYQMNFYAMRHCVVQKMLAKHDYLIHIDADSGVVNPYHCFEEYITPEIDLHMLLRVHTGEIQCGHYIVKNTKFGHQFLREWSTLTQKQLSGGSDQPALHHLVSQTILSLNDHQRCLALNKGSTYEKWVKCIVSSLRSMSTNHSRVLFYSRAQTFVRDGWATKFLWSQKDFMFHAMKRQDDVVFTRKLKEEDCASDMWEIPSKQTLYVDSIPKMKEVWTGFEKEWYLPGRYGIDFGIGHCWPNCPNLIV